MGYYQHPNKDIEEPMISAKNTYNTLRLLLRKADPRRVQRAGSMELVTAHREGDTLYASVRGSQQDLYQCRISLNPRGFHCTCRDCRKRGHEVGPCKHVIKMALIYLADEDA